MGLAVSVGAGASVEVATTATLDDGSVAPEAGAAELRVQAAEATVAMKSAEKEGMLLV